MSVSLEEIKKAAWDARLELTSREADILLEEITQIFDKAASFKNNTEGVSPTFYPLSITTVMREDKIQPSLPVSTALSNAEDADDYCFHVPRIIEE